MKITYKGKADVLTPVQFQKVEDRFAKIAKMLDGRQGEREAHVILTSERHLHNAEITVRFHDHDLVGIASSADLFPAISAAQEKLEKQLLKFRTKWRDNMRSPKDELAEGAGGEVAAAPEEEELPTEAPSGGRIFRIDHHEHSKPMTLDEALLEMEEDRNYIVYRNAETDRVAVLVRRRDGNFALIEA
jgi:putative sigma-54 modulation protein